MFETEQLGGLGTATPVSAHEDYASNDILTGIALPKGFIPDKPVPEGYSLQAALTTEENATPNVAKAFADHARRLAYRYGREAVFTAMNSGEGWVEKPDAPAVATFLQQDAVPLPRLTRVRQTLSRTLRGIMCDVNF